MLYKKQKTAMLLYENVFRNIGYEFQWDSF